MNRWLKAMRGRNNGDHPEDSKSRAEIRRRRAKDPPDPVRDIAADLGLSVQRVYQQIEKIREGK